MKQTFVKIVSRKFIPVLIISASLMAFAPVQSKANTKNNTIEIISNENTASVKFAGSTDNALFLDLKINNPKGDKFTLVIEGEDGEVLYTKEYTDTSFAKKLKILKDDVSSRYNISIRSANKDLENNFAVSAVSKTVDDVVVTKL
ncbi:MAG TPA: hypothetical protein VN958_06715 [Chitinophagaceae bacterium]|nr:hypothetical protein [Chitinophagaceae bacterium]